MTTPSINGTPATPITTSASLAPGGVGAMVAWTDGTGILSGPGYSRRAMINYAAEVAASTATPPVSQAQVLANALIAAFAAVSGNANAPAMLQVSQPNPAQPPQVRATYTAGTPTAYPAAGTLAIEPGTALGAAWAALNAYLQSKAA
jgi:hypothetical protein